MYKIGAHIFVLSVEEQLLESGSDTSLFNRSETDIGRSGAREQERSKVTLNARRQDCSAAQTRTNYIICINFNTNITLMSQFLIIWMVFTLSGTRTLLEGRFLRFQFFFGLYLDRALYKVLFDNENKIRIFGV